MNSETIILAEYLRDKAQKQAIVDSGLSNVFQPEPIKVRNAQIEAILSNYLARHLQYVSVSL